MEKDEYYEDAVRLVVQKDKASISMIQRKLRVGYNRAARMVEMMEQEGYVGPSDGNTAREVLIDSDPFAEENTDEEEPEE
jgi:S-DNA-T family DNA segregation ATPase FtsK/SpoIIIE